MLEKILEMSGGYVLDFSNSTFREFIFENSNIDIYDEKYAYIGSSKGKRLKAFWEKESNEIVGTLNLKLLEYWISKRVLNNISIDNTEQELYDNCIEISERLVDISKSVEKEKDNETNNVRNVFNNKQLELLNIFDNLYKAVTPRDKRNRGYILEKLIEDIFQLYQFAVEKPFRRNNGGEQIDGAFKFEGWHYLVECKWTEKLTDIRQLDSLYGKVNRGGKQTMGLFLSINGWSKHVEDLLKQNPEKSIILMDGMDLRYILDTFRDVDLNEILFSQKVSHLNYTSEPFYSVMRFEEEWKNK